MISKFAFERNNINWILESHPTNRVILGEACTFLVSNLPHGFKYRVFIKFEQINYTKPVCDWTSNSRFVFFPEALGNYTATLDLHHEDEGLIRYYLKFNVADKAGFNVDPQPTLLEGLHFSVWWGSSKWEANFYSSHERTIFQQLDRLIMPGWVIYDIGSNIGFHAMQFLMKTGDRGHVYCFEPNPLMVYFMHVNFSKNNLGNAEIFPVAITDRRKNIDFRLNPGNSLIGIGKDSSFFTSKTGMEIIVPGISLDEVIKVHDLKAPDLIKIDIEGAEGFALAGMVNTLRENFPVLILEIHSREAAENCFTILDDFYYRYFDPNHNKHYNCKTEVIDDFKDEITLYFCLPPSSNLHKP